MSPQWALWGANASTRQHHLPFLLSTFALLNSTFSSYSYSLYTLTSSSIFVFMLKLSGLLFYVRQTHQTRWGGLEVLPKILSGLEFGLTCIKNI